MASAIEDVSSLPGETVHDQEGRKIGEVKDIYAVGEETPMWVTVAVPTGVGRSRLAFVPLARLKHENDEIRVPYTSQHIQDSPEVEGEELSEEDDRELRGFYGIGLADQEMVASAQSYASQVPDEDEPARKVEADAVEGRVRELDEREPGDAAREADEAQREQGDDEDDDERRKTTAEDVLGEGEDEDESNGESKSESKGESRDEPKDEPKDESNDE